MGIVVEDFKRIEPLCPLFGECGGCSYQDISYDDQCVLKENQVRELFDSAALEVSPTCFFPIVQSPKAYHYRHRMDLKLIKTKEQNVFIGFSPVGRYRVVPVDDCFIAAKPLDDFIAQLKTEAIATLPASYRNANLVMRCGDEGKVVWGGIGRRSLLSHEDNYFWTDLILEDLDGTRQARRIFYGLDTFFQANLSILPALFKQIRSYAFINSETSFYDLYGGVGLFGCGLADRCRDIILIEENLCSIRLAQYNINYHGFKNFYLMGGRTEDVLQKVLERDAGGCRVAMIDPPRGGLTPSACEQLADLTDFNKLFYLSCNPQTLVRDLETFIRKGWQIKEVRPFDFFPQTKHIEILVLLEFS